MTVGLERGKAAKIPLWGIITFIASMLITAGSITLAATARASDADHRTIETKIAADAQRLVKVEELVPRVERLERAGDVTAAKLDAILDTLKRLERKLP